MIDLTKNSGGLAHNIQAAREKRIALPTFRQMKDPELAPERVRQALKSVGLWDVDPLNLYRITWKNEPVMAGGGYGGVNYLELPSSLTGVRARIICLVGQWFPTGCHKVGASYGCLVPRLVTGQFDVARHKAVWPSTGNYCRGGAFNSKLLSCDSIAILPAEMSRERFDWLSGIAGEVIATPGCESNVKEIFDKTWELRASRDDVMVFNQFEELGNALWHYQVTGNAIAEVYEQIRTPRSRFAGACFTSGSAGTMSAGDLLKEKYPKAKLAAAEALQCPTLLENGFGGHRIEGIGDKHVPWIHNIKNTDLVIAIDDGDSQNLLRLFNTEIGRQYLLQEAGVPAETVAKLPLMGISGIANMLACIKFAKYYELTGDDVVATVLTDSAVMYESRIRELDQEQGPYCLLAAARDYGEHLRGIRPDSLQELSYTGRRRVHNLKYYTWVEQQGKSVEELNRQWYDDSYWTDMHAQAEDLDALIDEFNAATGVLENR